MGNDHDASAVARHVEILKQVDGLVLCFPHWWFAMPAMLKGLRPSLRNMRHGLLHTRLARRLPGKGLAPHWSHLSAQPSSMNGVCVADGGGHVA